MKIILILADLFLISAVIMEIMEDYGGIFFNVSLMLALGLLGILNIYYLVNEKDKWTDKLFKKKFFKKYKLLKIILIPLLAFSLLALILPEGRRFFTVVLPSSVSYIWHSNINPDYYTDSWTGIVTHKESGCTARDSLKTKVICERWGEMEKEKWAGETATYKCYKNCPIKGRVWEGYKNSCEFIDKTCTE